MRSRARSISFCDVSPSVANRSAAAAARFASSYSVRAEATALCWASAAVESVASRFASPCSASVSWRSASSDSSWTSGFERSSSTVPASTFSPARAWMRSTRPAVTAGIQRICSGTSAPVPRTWRSIPPRFTVSV